MPIHHLSFALKASGWHLLAGALLAALSAALTFTSWYTFPYAKMAIGSQLFLIPIAVEVVCGLLLTRVLFSPAKLRSELVRYLVLIVFIQLAVLWYGLNTIAQARPLALVLKLIAFAASRDGLAHPAG